LRHGTVHSPLETISPFLRLCLREPCFVFRASRNDHDVALATDPLFTAEAEFHSVLHRVSRTAPSRSGSALNNRCGSWRYGKSGVCIGTPQVQGLPLPHETKAD